MDTNATVIDAFTQVWPKRVFVPCHPSWKLIPKGAPEVERKEGSRSSAHYTDLANSVLVADYPAIPSEEGAANADIDKQ